jgi:hypothetical protein
MFLRRGLLIALIFVPVVALVASCSPEPEPTPTETVAPPVSSSPTLATPGPLDPDITLVVSATAIAPNGAKLDLEMRVHESTSYADLAAGTLPVAVADACPEELTKALFASQKWSFTRANVSALPSADSTADWPSDALIGIQPSANFAPIAARGFVTDSDPAAAEPGSCRNDKSFVGAGSGGIAVGIPHDAVEEGSLGGYTKWTNHRFGFLVEGGGVTLQDCDIQVLDLGTKFGANGAGWTPLTNSTTCSVGAATETKEF